ncbi:DUF927 domain-containing protein [Xanthobacter autotrophicus]|uniref:DUF927 domain-containing protein n=1 Tax=Xanthobacter autotrophicus TaxID=280 RepID=UPI00372BC147
MQHEALSTAPLGQTYWIHVVEAQQDLDTDRCDLLVEFTTRTGGSRRVMLRQELLASPAKILSALHDLGAWPMASLKAEQTSIEAALREPSSPVPVLHRTGWLGKDFVLPDRVIGSNARGVKFVDDDGRESTFTRGSHGAWKRTFGQFIRESTVLLTLTAAAFVGPLLAVLGRDGFPLLHVVGGDRKWREMALRTALAVAGPASRNDLLRHNRKVEVHEKELRSRRDLIAAFIDHPSDARTDARQHSLGNTAAAVIAGTFGGPPRNQVGAECLVALSADLHDDEAPIDTMGGSVCLVPFDEILLDRREQVAMNLPTVLRSLEKATSSATGGALPNFIQRLQENIDTINKSVREYEADFISRAATELDADAAPDFRAFALIYAVACLAKDFKVAPWSRKRALAAILATLERSRRVSRPAADMVDQALRTLVDQMENSRIFPLVEEGQGVTVKQAGRIWGIRRTRAGRLIVAVLSNRFEKIAPMRRSEVLRGLAARGVLLRGKGKGHHGNQIQVQGLAKKVNFLCFDLAALQDLRSEWESEEK